MRGADAGAVLVLRALGLGDALTGVPALRGLRRAFPQSPLVLAAPSGLGAWLRDLGVVDAVLPTHGLEPLDLRAVRAVAPRGHVAVDLHGRGPESHRVLLGTDPARLVAFASAQVGHEGPTWHADEHEVHRWCRLVREGTGAPCGPQDLVLGVDGGGERPGPAPVVLHPGAASGSRRWPAERWARLAGSLVGDGYHVVVTGGPQERLLADSVLVGLPRDRVRSVAGTLDLPALAALVAGARLLVCGDTGVAHVATATRTPSVLLFGPTPPQWWGPAVDPEQHRVLYVGDPSRPGDPHGADPDPALLALGVDEVRSAVSEMLAGHACDDGAAARRHGAGQAEVASS